MLSEKREPIRKLIESLVEVYKSEESEDEIMKDI